MTIDFENCKAIRDFLFYYGNKGTRKTHLCTVRKFFECIDKDPCTYFNDDKNKQQKIEEYKDDIRKYIDSIRESPPKTFYSYASVIKMFFRRNEVNIPPFFWDFKAIKKGSKPLTQDRPPDIDEMKEILAFADFKSTTIFLVLLSSGMRVGELCQIRLNDIEFRDDKPTKIRLRPEYTKTGQPRITFISDEATLFLKEWINKYLDNYKDFKNSYGRFKSIRDDKKDTRVFPLSVNAIRQNLITILNKSYLNKKDDITNRFVIHIHTFRKFFKSRMSQKCPLGIVEMLMGHIGYLANSYDRYTEHDLENAYIKAMPMISIYETGITRADLEQLENEIKRRDQRIEEMEEFKEKIEERTAWLEKLNKEQLKKLLMVLEGKAEKDVWEEWEKRPKNWRKIKKH